MFQNVAPFSLKLACRLGYTYYDTANEVAVDGVHEIVIRRYYFLPMRCIFSRGTPDFRRKHATYFPTGFAFAEDTS